MELLLGSGDQRGGGGGGKGGGGSGDGKCVREGLCVGSFLRKEGRGGGAIGESGREGLERSWVGRRLDSEWKRLKRGRG